MLGFVATWLAVMVQPIYTDPLLRGEAGTAISANKRCRATFIKPHLVVDDDGYVCRRAGGFDPAGSSCCTSRAAEAQFACHECNEKNRCCREFEHCVSCCLSPQHKGLMTAAGDAWDSCLDRCRTSSASILNGNRYTSNDKHCFGNSGGLPAGDGWTRSARVHNSQPGLQPGQDMQQSTVSAQQNVQQAMPPPPPAGNPNGGRCQCFTCNKVPCRPPQCQSCGRAGSGPLVCPTPSAAGCYTEPDDAAPMGDCPCKF